MSKYLIRCFKSVEARVTEDPFVRRSASEMAEKLMALLPPDAEERTRALSLSQMCESTYSCVISLIDGSCQEVIYDAYTRVEHVVPQIAWAIGLEDYKTFGLFELRSGKHLRLERKRFLTTVVNTMRFLDDRDEERSRLLMKKKIIRSPVEEKKDPKGLELTYAQAKIQYLHSEYPLENTQAVRLCIYLIQGDHLHAGIYQDENRLFAAVEERIPQNVCHNCFRFPEQC